MVGRYHTLLENVQSHNITIAWLRQRLRVHQVLKDVDRQHEIESQIFSLRCARTAILRDLRDLEAQCSRRS